MESRAASASSQTSNIERIRRTDIVRSPLTDSRAQGLSRALLGVAAAACALFAIVLLYPGQYPYDAANQLWQARTGRFGNGSPVAMVAFLSVLWNVTGNPATLFCLNVAMYWTGLALCFMAVGGYALVRVALLVAIGLAPLALLQMAHVLTDAHLAALMMLATGFAAWGLAAREPPTLAVPARLPLAALPRPERMRPAAWNSRAALVACGVTIVYAGCIRHNALLATVPFVAVIVPAIAPAKLPKWKVALTSVAALVFTTMLAGFALDRTLVSTRISVWPTLALWDLAAISVERKTLLLPSFTHGPGMTPEELAQTGAFDPTVNVPLFQRSRSGMRDGYDDPYTSAEKRAIFSAWLHGVREYPVAYVRHRLRTFALLIGRHGDPVHGVAYVHGRVQYKDNPALPDMWAPRAQAALYRMASELEPGWSFAALPYLLGAVLAAVIGWKRRDRPTACLALAVSGSVLLYAAGYAGLAPAADLRYLTWPIVASPLALALALLPSGIR